VNGYSSGLQTILMEHQPHTNFPNKQSSSYLLYLRTFVGKTNHRVQEAISRTDEGGAGEEPMEWMIGVCGWVCVLQTYRESL